MNRRDSSPPYRGRSVWRLRLALSGSTPANVIGTSTATVSQPREVSQTSVQVAPKNITAAEATARSSAFSCNRPSGSQLQPQIVAVIGDTGKALPVQNGRPFRSGVSDEAVAFFKDSSRWSGHHRGDRRRPVHGLLSGSRRPWSVMSTATARSISRIFRHSLPRTDRSKERPTTIPPPTSTRTA